VVWLRETKNVHLLMSDVGNHKLCKTDALLSKSCNNKFVVQLKWKNLKNTSIQQGGQKVSG